MNDFRKENQMKDVGTIVALQLRKIDKCTKVKLQIVFFFFFFAVALSADLLNDALSFVYQMRVVMQNDRKFNNLIYIEQLIQISWSYIYFSKNCLHALS